MLNNVTPAGWSRIQKDWNLVLHPEASASNKGAGSMALLPLCVQRLAHSRA